MIEKIIVGIALWFCGYTCGYLIGFDRCFKILKVKVVEAMVAMLTELQLEIQEVNTAPQFLTDDNVKDFREYVDAIIQQKINVLKAESEVEE